VTTSLAARISIALGTDVRRLAPLAGGCVGDVSAVDLSSGDRVVVKAAPAGADARLDLEGWMLGYLGDRSALPVPAVRYAASDLLIMDLIDTSGGITGDAERDAADHLAGLHNIQGQSFGLERDTLIGGLHQPNTESQSWLTFFAEQRLFYMATEAHTAGHLPVALMDRVERLCGKLPDWLSEPAHPSLIHGDMWTGNVLCHGGRIAGFIDPAIYYADAEIELAFATLFGTFGDAFFARYEEHRPLAPGFFEERRNLYNLYPLLLHVRLFGGSYVQSVERTLKKFGV
jgi:fructosamine-3-kinase